jgi:hypothetical protein
VLLELTVLVPFFDLNEVLQGNIVSKMSLDKV